MCFPDNDITHSSVQCISGKIKDDGIYIYIHRRNLKVSHSLFLRSMFSREECVVNFARVPASLRCAKVPLRSGLCDMNNTICRV